MRVLVATDAIGALSSLRAGSVLATGWSADDVVVVPVGEAGAGFVQAAADALGVELVSGMFGQQAVVLARQHGTTLLGVEPATADPGAGIPFDASSSSLGAAIADAVSVERPHRLVIDLTGPAVHDAGAGLLAALGAEADVDLDRGVRGLAGISRLDLGVVRSTLAGIDLVGVVPGDELGQPLLGLRGITSVRRGPEIDPAQLLATDESLAALARLAAPDDAGRPGAGACGGLGFAVLALGGRLVSGPEFAWEHAGPRALADVELVVTGCTTFDFARRGGGVVAGAARLAGDRLAACIAVAGEVLIGSRELRTMGIESAYAVRGSGGAAAVDSDVTETELGALARRVGRSWRW